MPAVDNDRTSQCRICLENQHSYEPQIDQRFFELPCGHGGPGDLALHKVCLGKVENTKCPICDADFGMVIGDVNG
jgi:hypothetical protein